MASKRHVADVLDRMGFAHALLAARGWLFPWRWLTVLTYHRVAPTVAPGYDPEVLDASPATFTAQVRLLQRYFNLIDTRDLDRWRAGGPLPSNPAMITFDDGYRDNHDVVMPILRDLGAKAVFFVSTSYITERRVFWWELVNRALGETTRPRLQLDYPVSLDLPLVTPADRRAATRRLLLLLKRQEGVDIERFLDQLHAALGVRLDDERALCDRLLMSWDHIRALAAAGFDVQSHSHAHRVLHTLSADEVRRDLLRARHELEGALDRPVSAVAYPTGRPLGNAPHLRQAVLDAGYRYGFTVERLRPLAHMHDWLGLPRMMVEQAVTTAVYRSTLAVPALAY